MAPQATVINIYGHTGKCVGCISVKLISGIEYPPEIIPYMIPTAIMIRTAPKIG